MINTSKERIIADLIAEDKIEKELRKYFYEYMNSTIDMDDEFESEEFQLGFDKYMQKNFFDIWGDYDVMSYAEYFYEKEIENTLENMYV